MREIKHKIVKVEWVDAQTQKNRLSLEDIKFIKDAETTTIGFLVYEDKNKIAICSWIHKFDDGDLYCDTHIIPRSLIKSIKEIK